MQEIPEQRNVWYSTMLGSMVRHGWLRIEALLSFSSYRFITMLYEFLPNTLTLSGS